MRILKIIIILVFLMVFINFGVHAEEIAFTDGFREYTGSIDGNLNITLLLEKKGNLLEGQYYYDSQRIFLILRGEMVDENNFILEEFDDDKKTGIFRGVVAQDGRIEGTWLNQAGTVEYPFYLLQKPPSEWAGKWRRIGYYFSPANLMIWNVSETGFDFSMSAASGGHTGRIRLGRAEFTDNLAVYDAGKGARLLFSRGDGKLHIKQDGDVDAGIGVVYSGEYKKGNVIIVPPTLTESKVFKDATQEQAFKALVGEDDYDMFLKSFHLVSEQKDLDEIGATVYRGGVRGLFTYMEGIIMTTPAGEIWAAVLVPRNGTRVVKYFTNSTRFSSLPLTIDNWRARFKEREVFMVYRPSSQVTQSFYGRWKITKYLGRSYISALSDEEVGEKIGKQMEYFAEKASSGTTEVINPIYLITTINIFEFERGWRVNAKKLGIEGETIRQVRIDSSSGRSDLGMFYIKDNDTLIYSTDGCWFEMKRVDS